MHPLLVRFVGKTAVGLVAIAVGVPYLQNRVLVLSTVEAPALSITGDITDLTPAHPGRLLLTVHNQGGTGTVVRHLSAVPDGAVPGCTIAITPWVGELPVGAHGSASQSLAVQISGPRCSGMTWQLTYTATA